MARWDPVIQRNRAAPTLSFPLKSSSFKKETKKDYAQRFTPLSDLEIALAALEPEKENKEKPKKDDFDLTLEEVVLKRHEAAKFRAQQVSFNAIFNNLNNYFFSHFINSLTKKPRHTD